MGEQIKKTKKLKGAQNLVDSNKIRDPFFEASKAVKKRSESKETSHRQRGRVRVYSECSARTKKTTQILMIDFVAVYLYLFRHLKNFVPKNRTNTL